MLIYAWIGRKIQSSEKSIFGLWAVWNIFYVFYYWGKALIFWCISLRVLSIVFIVKRHVFWSTWADFFLYPFHWECCSPMLMIGSLSSSVLTLPSPVPPQKTSGLPWGPSASQTSLRKPSHIFCEGWPGGSWAKVDHSALATLGSPDNFK